jgi:hypothetical protein
MQARESFAKVIGSFYSRGKKEVPAARSANENLQRFGAGGN